MGLYHFAVLLPTRAALGRFFRQAMERRVRVGAADHLFSEALYLVDPDGITVEVYRDRPRAEWTYRDGELVAATDPLDVDEVLASAGDERWSGLPAGTTIGHMHFHVGDLGVASRFYVDALGFEPVIRTYPGALFVSAGGYHHHVGLNTWRSGAPVATDRDAGLVSWDLVVPPETVDAVRARCQLAGASLSMATTPPGFVARDPWGTAVRVVTSAA